MKELMVAVGNGNNKAKLICITNTKLLKQLMNDYNHRCCMSIRKGRMKVVNGVYDMKGDPKEDAL